MGKLTYLFLASLDGFVVDRDGNFDWARPTDEVHAAVNDYSRTVGTSLLGRRMYEVLRAWETLDTSHEPPVIADFARIWHDTYKIVYSSSLHEVATERTMIEPAFEPEAVAQLKASSDRDLSIGGPGLAAHAFRAGLVDEIRLFVVPHVAGGGTALFPDDVRLELDLLDERRFDDGTVHLRYRVGS